MTKRPKLKIDQISKIRPFFQSARHADSKNAKKFEQILFFEEALIFTTLSIWSRFFTDKELT